MLFWVVWVKSGINDQSTPFIAHNCSSLRTGSPAVSVKNFSNICRYLLRIKNFPCCAHHYNFTNVLTIFCNIILFWGSDGYICIYTYIFIYDLCIYQWSRVRLPALWSYFLYYFINSKSLCFQAEFKIKLVRVIIKTIPMINLHISSSFTNAKLGNEINGNCRLACVTEVNQRDKEVSYGTWADVVWCYFTGPKHKILNLAYIYFSINDEVIKLVFKAWLRIYTLDKGN